uniref:Uncharacterized protein n=1 Tax=Fagus sylvatica TaxID=28930 RepID=A0A2N9H1R1_FAGSY
MLMKIDNPDKDGESSNAVEVREAWQKIWKLNISSKVEEFTRWAIMAWSLWNARNRFIYEGMQASPEHIVKRGASILRKFQSLLVRVGSSSSLIIPTTN